jgi:arylsulfatase A-like enzyme
MHYPDKIKSGLRTEALVSGEDIAPTFLEMAGLEIPEDMSGISVMPALLGEPYEGHDYVIGERGPHASRLPTNTARFDLGRTIIKDRYKLIYNCLYQLPYIPIDFGGMPFWKELVRQNQDQQLSPPYDRIFFSEPRPMFELYDLQEDPHELNNLIDTPELAEVQ